MTSPADAMTTDPDTNPPGSPDTFEGLGQKHWKSDRVKEMEAAERRAPRPGYVQVYTGDGKGKTTASLGLVLRAAGYGHKSCVISFMKGDPNYGELRAFEQFMPDLVDYHLAGRPNFVDPSNPDPEDIRVAQEGLDVARQSVMSGEYHVVVLDEINVAVTLGLIDAADVVDLLKSRPRHVEVVMTGRDVPEELARHADLISEVKAQRHFYDAGIPARRGIEF